MAEERIPKNVAQLVKVQRARRKRPEPWSVEEACTFLENAQIWRDYLCSAYVLVLVLGLRKGEVLGLTWSDVNLDTGSCTSATSYSGSAGGCCTPTRPRRRRRRRCSRSPTSA